MTKTTYLILMVKNTLNIRVKFCEKYSANDLHRNIANKTFELKENDIECPIYMLESNNHYQSIERTLGNIVYEMIKWLTTLVFPQ